MPNHGIELIDGIPVTLKGSEMFAFQPGSSQAPAAKRIKLGNYDTTTKKATWDNTDEMKKWVEDFQASLVPRSRK
jgi:hypothetical protein